MRIPRVIPLLLVLPAACAQQAAQPQAEARAESGDARMDWWRDARFGMFIHWGLYAIPAGTWGSETGHGEWIMNTAHIPVEQYEKFREQFNPVKFDADRIVSTAKNAGMKYIVITSKHHDGFCLFDSKYTDYDVMSTPFHRDIMKEMSEACARQGMRMCFYHSIMDWHHPDYLPRRDWETRSTAGADFDRYVDYLHNEVSELLTNYGPIGVMWFDGEWESTWNHGYGQPLYELCRRLQPDVIVNNRVDVGRGGMGGMTEDAALAGDFGTPEQEIPATGIPGVDWETCMTMNDHWGYNSHDKDFKSTRDLIRMLVDVASKGGNYLLNVGPTAEGEIPPESVQRLQEIGRWMAVNGDAIHGTQASPFAALPWGRCTVRPGKESTLYLHVFDWPADGVLTVPGLGSEPLRAYLMADPQHPLPCSRADSDVRVQVPRPAPDADCSVVALVVPGAPVIYRAPEIQADASMFVHQARFRITCASPELELHYTTDGSVPTMASPRVTGEIRLEHGALVQARAFHHGRAVTPVVAQTFTQVTPAPAGPAPAQAGLQRESYRGDWNVLPDFQALTPSARDAAAEIAPLAEEHMGLRFTGRLRVAQDEVYRFVLSADDGARLWIGDQLVVDNDGLHSPEEKSGQAALARGWHPIRVEWFNKTGGYDLSLKLAAPGQEPALPAAADLAHP